MRSTLSSSLLSLDNDVVSGEGLFTVWDREDALLLGVLVLDLLRFLLVLDGDFTFLERFEEPRFSCFEECFDRLEVLRFDVLLLFDPVDLVRFSLCSYKDMISTTYR